MIRNTKGGGAPWFVALSVAGIVLGVGLLIIGKTGGSLSSYVLMGIGAFITIKEVLDIFV